MHHESHIEKTLKFINRMCRRKENIKDALIHVFFNVVPISPSLSTSELVALYRFSNTFSIYSSSKLQFISTCHTRSCYIRSNAVLHSIESCVGSQYTYRLTFLRWQFVCPPHSYSSDCSLFCLPFVSIDHDCDKHLTGMLNFCTRVIVLQFGRYGCIISSGIVLAWFCPRFCVYVCFLHACSHILMMYSHRVLRVILWYHQGQVNLSLPRNILWWLVHTLRDYSCYWLLCYGVSS